MCNLARDSGLHLYLPFLAPVLTSLLLFWADVSLLSLCCFQDTSATGVTSPLGMALWGRFCPAAASQLF